MDELTAKVIELAEKYRNALLKNDMAALDQVIKAFQVLYKDLAKRVNELGELIAKMDKVSPAALRRISLYNRILEETEEELAKLGNFAEVVIKQHAIDAIAMAGVHAKNITRIMTEYGNIEASWMSLNPEAVASLMGFLQKGSDLYKNIKEMAKWNTKKIKDMFIELMSVGDNPKTIARKIFVEYGKKMGMALTDIMRMTRTAQLYAYRESTLAHYRANSDIISGWIWWAELEGACMSCVAMHGTKHTLDEHLNDHHNGRCAMLPILKYSPANISESAGLDWYEQQSEKVQRDKMGDARYAAWKEGKFVFSQLSTEYDNDVYGKMRGEASLKNILGGEQQ